MLIDFSNRPANELTHANTMAHDKCGIFGKTSAALESLNPRADDRMRATYTCS